MTAFVYIDYGPSPDIATELRYSLATLFHEYRGREPAVTVYTDKPTVYASLHPRIFTRELGSDFALWSRDGLYAHRVKPCALIDALTLVDEACVLVDSDTFIRSGFAAALARAFAEDAVAMDSFERADHYPAANGFAAELPGLGRYAYRGATTLMYNSGLVAARRRHIPVLEDAVALIDALIDAGLDQFNIEQIAVSESLRLHGERICEMKPWFEHYYRRSQKLYMRPRIADRFARKGGWEPLAPFLEPSKFRVRSASVLDKAMRFAESLCI